ncbi:hypothetical protein CLV43_10826 [Umezawaea tangerina]|uniref:Uncharacterized protein n=1 Tax=Umezawaea tangerina TaxID=84725 RepID=A0A2T0SYZ0_9PSEU|nr:hypothetical protein CLV43_10826 [Umezawaea tangerina]
MGYPVAKQKDRVLQDIGISVASTLDDDRAAR